MLNYQDDLIRQLTQGRNTGITGGAYNTQPLEVPGLQSPGERAPDLAGDTAPAKTMPEHKGTKIGGFADLGSYDLSKSPKGQFANLVNSGQYGYNQGGDILKELQRLYPQHWNNVTWNGRDVFNVGAQGKHADWGDADMVDFAAAFNDQTGDAKDFYWGVDGPSARTQREGGQRGGGMNALTQLHGLLTGAPGPAIQSALGQYTQQSDYLKALLAQLGV